MLPRENRLTSDRDFSYIFKKGRSFRGQSFNLRFLANKKAYSRFGFVVSNKISKKATERNKIKRRLRAIIGANSDQINAGYDVVIIVSPKILNLNFQELKLELEALLKKIKLLN